MTHTATQQQQFDTLAQQVCHLTGWQMNEYSGYMEKCGKQYLQEYIPQDPQGIDMLVGSKLYWAWWRTNWYQRDAQFVYHMLAGPADLIVLLYKELHDPRTLAKCIYPNGIVLNYSYATMIQQVIDKKGEGGL